MEAPSWMLQARTSDVERQEAQRGVTGNIKWAQRWLASGAPPCSPPLYHPLAEGWVASTLWRDSGAPLEGS